ncbi:MAG: hypothetical protein K2Y35_17310 [Burkholderiales bacterium]|nr:hypothetical protein [Burkholderiales bacterium]
MSKNNVTKKLFDVTKVSELTSLINDLADEVSIKWRPVGGNDNNLAIIGIGSDPAAGVIERTTNAIDSVLELEWVTKGEPTSITSPRMATEKWFGIKEGRLANYRTNDLKKLEKHAARVEISLRDSDRDDKPTIDIRDYGIGILPEDFAESILSLNKNRKLRKLFLAGAFGQGGSSALAYSPLTLICSRKANVHGGKPHPFAFTVVRFNPGDANVDKHGVYEYMVDGKTGCPITLNVPEDEFPAGTLVRHLTMEVGKYNAVMTAPTGSLWFLVHNYLFDPVFPFRIQDKRTGKNPTARMVTGNHRLLSQGEHTEYQRDATLTFRDGSVQVKWWVLSAEGESARARLTQYVMVSQPVVVTYNGQKQGYFPNTIIKDDLKLPYLDRYLVVHVDCDKLDADSRRQLFPTTREALRDTPIGDDLRRLVIDTLAGDDDLRRLDQERKQRYIKQEDQGAVDAIRRRLAKRVKSMTITGGEGTGPRVTPPSGDPVPSKRQPIPVQDPPTYLKITGATPRRVYAGRSFTIKFETDARPDYFVSADNFIAVISPPSLGQYTGTASVREGYGVAYFKAQEDVEVGAIAKITLELRPPKHTSLSDTTEVIVSELPQTAGGQQGEAATPNINPRWVTEGEQFWRDMGWTKRSVAQVNREVDGVDIYVSASNEKLGALISRAQRRDIHAVDQIKNFYLEHLCFYALLQDTERLLKQDSQNNGENSSPGDADLKLVSEAGLRHACETVCGIIEGIFEVLVNAPEEK